MIRVGDKIPDIELRTDEGTPLALTDLAGRAIVVFMLGEGFTPTVERLLRVLGKNTGRFLAIDVSPVAVLGETTDQLAEFREHNDVPYLLISDPALSLHRRLMGEDGYEVGVWIVDEESVTRETIPTLPPTELVALAAERAQRFRAGKSTKRDEESS